ncbi:MAG: Fic family protein [Patescibacteria group bacterium]
MLIPEYSVTTEILKNISAIEYGRGIIENTTILPSWDRQLKREALIKDTFNILSLGGHSILKEIIKKAVDEVSERTPKEISNYLNAKEELTQLASFRDFEEQDIKKLHTIASTQALNKKGRYRGIELTYGTKPQEILAEMVELMDWYHSIDAKDTHPVLTAGIMHGYIEHIVPFESSNRVIANLTALLILKSHNYHISEYFCLSEFYNQDLKSYDFAINSIDKNEEDLTKWLEYFTRGMANEISTLTDKVLLLAKDTKIAQASGKAELSRRQEKIVLYLQDYGRIQNVDFEKLFPHLSEDTVLRDLKTLIDKGIVEKKGKTKSSRYELKK